MNEAWIVGLTENLFAMSTFFPAAALLLALVGAEQQAASLSDFRAADPATRARLLSRIATRQQDAAIADLIALVRAGLQDSSPTVRLSALGAVMVRTMASRWAGTSGPMSGPNPVPGPEWPIVPADWKGDQQRLLDALEDDCLTMLKNDPDARVRHEALLTIVNLERPIQPAAPIGDRLVGLLVGLYRHDPDVRIRAEALKTLRLVPNDTPEIRAVLRVALVDSNPSIRQEALNSIPPKSAPAPRRLPFAEARETIDAALKHADPGVRLGAVQALNVFGAPAVSYVQTLERLSAADPDPLVRASARLAIESIQRALKRPSPRLEI